MGRELHTYMRASTALISCHPTAAREWATITAALPGPAAAAATAAAEVDKVDSNTITCFALPLKRTSGTWSSWAAGSHMW